MTWLYDQIWASNQSCYIFEMKVKELQHLNLFHLIKDHDLSILSLYQASSRQFCRGFVTHEHVPPFFGHKKIKPVGIYIGQPLLKSANT